MSQYLTIVFQVSLDESESVATAMTSHPNFSAASWSHALHDRDKAADRIAELEARTPAATDDIARAIFYTFRPANMVETDWDSGAVLGKDNYVRNKYLNAAKAVLSLCTPAAPVVEEGLTDDVMFEAEYRKHYDLPPEADIIAANGLHADTARLWWNKGLAAHPVAGSPAEAFPTFGHPDDSAVDRFAVAMKSKMAAARAKGRGGWDNEALCPAERLQAMLRDHVSKGDPVDVGNFAMMLFNRGERTAGAPMLVAALTLLNEISFLWHGDEIAGGSKFDSLMERVETFTFPYRRLV